MTGLRLFILAGGVLAGTLQSTYKLKNDIITFHDYGGMNSCNDLAGSYHVKINGDTLVLVMDEDPCDTRGGMLILKPWIRSH